MYKTENEIIGYDDKGEMFFSIINSCSLEAVGVSIPSALKLTCGLPWIKIPKSQLSNIFFDERMLCPNLKPK